MKTKKRTQAELKAMAYAIADEVETRAEAIWQRAPKLTRSSSSRKAGSVQTVRRLLRALHLVRLVLPVRPEPLPKVRAQPSQTRANPLRPGSLRTCPDCSSPATPERSMTR